jgi:hypothetical protein
MALNKVRAISQTLSDMMLVVVGGLFLVDSILIRGMLSLSRMMKRDNFRASRCKDFGEYYGTVLVEV